MPQTESDAIVEYALRGPEQLELVALTCQAYDQLCATLYSRFLTALAPVVRKRLGSEWSVQIWPDTTDISKRWAIFLSARRANRTDDLRIDLGADERRFPKLPYLAIRATEGSTFGSLTKSDVFSKLNTTHRRGGTSEVSIWYWYFPPPFKYIGEVNDLKQLLELTECLDYYGREIEATAQVLEQTLGFRTPSSEPA
jgi:hypothetical protein